MDNKKSTNLILVVWVILLCVGALVVGFWLGTKKYNQSRESNQTDENLLVEKIDFPQKSDDGVYIGDFYEILTEKELKTNFKNLEKKVNGNTLIFNCEEFDKGEPSCAKIKLTINGEFTYEEEVPYAIGDYEGISFYKVNNYYIIYIHNTEGGCDYNKLSIYKNNAQVYKSSLPIKSHYELKDGNYKETIFLKPNIVNNVLHYVEQVDAGAYGNYDTLRYNTIDLNKSDVEVSLVKQFKGYFSTCER